MYLFNVYAGLHPILRLSQLLYRRPLSCALVKHKQLQPRVLVVAQPPKIGNHLIIYMYMATGHILAGVVIYGIKKLGGIDAVINKQCHKFIMQLGSATAPILSCLFFIQDTYTQLDRRWAQAPGPYKNLFIYTQLDEY